MSQKTLTELSKFLSYVLRHRPDAIHLSMEKQGWVGVQELIRNAQEAGKPLTLDLLKTIVANDDKQRYALNPDGTKIRANQGHSIEIDLNLQSLTPPRWLYHGTAERNLASIYKSGLQKQQRHHVHLSQDAQMAKRVGARYGKPVILRILAQAMVEQGFVFYCSDNQVWLTDHVPSKFIEFPETVN